MRKTRGGSKEEGMEEADWERRMREGHGTEGAAEGEVGGRGAASIPADPRTCPVPCESL